MAETTTGKLISAPVDMHDLVKLVDKLRGEFTDRELFEAFCVFQYLTIRTFRKNEVHDVFESQGYLIRERFTDERFEDLKIEFGIRHVFDIRKLGASLVAIEFSDF